MILAITKRWHLWRHRAASWLLYKVVTPLARRLDASMRRDGQKANDQHDKARLRMEVCKRCPLLTEAQFCDRSKGGCGCYMPAKVQVGVAKCPQGRW